MIVIMINNIISRGEEYQENKVGLAPPCKLLAEYVFFFELTGPGTGPCAVTEVTAIPNPGFSLLLVGAFEKLGGRVILRDWNKEQHDTCGTAHTRKEIGSSPVSATG